MTKDHEIPFKVNKEDNPSNNSNENKKEQNVYNITHVIYTKN